MAQRSPRCETLVASSVTRCIRYMYKQAAAIAAYIILPNSLPLKREKKIKKEVNFRKRYLYTKCFTEFSAINVLLQKVN